MLRTLLVIILFSGYGIACLGKGHTIRLADKKMAKPIKKFTVEELVDLRLEVASIGSIPSTATGPRIPVNFDKPFKLELQEFLKNNTEALPDAVPVIMKINKFKVSERIFGEMDIASVEIAVEFLARKDGQYYKLLDAGTVKEATSRVDVTKKHTDNIVHAMLDIATQLSRINIPETLNQAPALEPGYLQENTYLKPDFTLVPILNTTTYKKGLYRHFQEFKNNNPSITNFSHSYKGFLDAKGQKIKKYWGYSDGTNLYMVYGPDRRLHKLEKKNEFFSFNATVTTVNSNAVLLGSLAGGLAGGFIAGALSQQNHNLDLRLNMLTGLVTEPEGYGPEADLAKTAKVVFYRKQKGEATEKLDIYVKDSLYASLLPNSYEVINFRVPVQEYQFYLNGNKERPLTYAPGVDQINYIECSRPNRKERYPVLKPVGTKEATYYIKLIQSSQKKQQPKDYTLKWF